MFKLTALPIMAACLAFGALSSPTYAQSPDAAVSPGTYLHNTVAIKWESKGQNVVMKVVDADIPSGQAISSRTKKRKSKPWDVALWVKMDGAVKKGDQVQMRFWARTAKPPKGKDKAEFVVFVGRDEEPYDYIISEEFSPDTEWKSYTLTGTANADYNSGKLKAEYQLGKQKQTVEFGGIYVSNLGPVTG